MSSSPPDLHGAEPWLQFAALGLLPAVRACEPASRRRRQYRPSPVDDPDWFESCLVELLATRAVDEAFVRRGRTFALNHSLIVTQDVGDMFVEFCDSPRLAAIRVSPAVQRLSARVQGRVVQRIVWECSRRRSGSPAVSFAAAVLDEQLRFMCMNAVRADLVGSVGVLAGALASGLPLSEAVSVLSALGVTI